MELEQVDKDWAEKKKKKKKYEGKETGFKKPNHLSRGKSTNTSCAWAKHYVHCVEKEKKLDAKINNNHSNVMINDNGH